MGIASSCTKAGKRFTYIWGSEQQVREALPQAIRTGNTTKARLWEMLKSGRYTSSLVLHCPPNKDDGDPNVLFAIKPNGIDHTLIFDLDADLSRNGRTVNKVGRRGDVESSSEEIKLHTDIFTLDLRPVKQRQQGGTQIRSCLSTNEQKLASTARYLGATLRTLDRLIRRSLTGADLLDDGGDKVLVKADSVMIEQETAIKGSVPQTPLPTGFYLDSKSHADRIYSHVPASEIGVNLEAGAKHPIVPASIIEYGDRDLDVKDFESELRKIFSSLVFGIQEPSIISVGNEALFKEKSGEETLREKCGCTDMGRVINDLKSQIHKAEPGRDTTLPRSLRYALKINSALQQQKRPAA